MPVYEYWCPDCKMRQEILLPRFNSDPPPCPKCGSNALQRRFSTFMMQKSYKAVYDDILGDSQMMRGMMNNDPQALAAWNNKMSGGEPVAPEYQETLERMERGEAPSLPAEGGETTG
ncbi:MAG: zinc ribbon domain-containing protein [Dehalococcoidia bacterium]|nr:zinc ribbon domain-containing protein [Dehalococcoidia bacterium]MDD5647954.1 zinc ribbon domain-containing protein [Dehalococcoidia bacterium]